MYECQSISASDVFTTIRQLYLTRQRGRSLSTALSLLYTYFESLGREILAVEATNTQLYQELLLRCPSARHLEPWAGGLKPCYTECPLMRVAVPVACT